MTLRHNARTFWSILFVILTIDQAAKWVIRARLTEGAGMELWPGVFHLTYVRNMGAAFGLFPGRQPVFVITTAVVLFVIAAYWRRSHPTAPLIVTALALVAAGSIGNAIDRLVLGSVTDFFDFTLVDFPVFNVADSAIVIGVGILIGWLLFVPEQPSEVSSDAEESEQPLGGGVS